MGVVLEKSLTNFVIEEAADGDPNLHSAITAW
jgi:hypothetical protein